MKQSLKNRFLQFVRRHRLITSGQKILVAVSGGVDSMVLLHLLRVWQPYFQTELAILHINHQLRGAESDADADFVRQQAANWDIPVIIKKVNVREYARREKLSLEEAGRLLREKVYQETLHEAGYHLVATAHHLDDQVETLWMRLLKGTGIEGLAGIRLHRPGMIRPLLFATRKEIEEYAAQHQIPFREDKSNRDLRFLRNRIRHRLIPFLQSEFNFRDFSSFLQLSLIVQEWLDYVQQEVEKALQTIVQPVSENKIALDITGYSRYFSGIQKRILETILTRLLEREIHLNFHQFTDFQEWLAAQSRGSQFRLHRQVVCWKENERVIISQAGQVEARSLEIFPGQDYQLPDGKTVLRMEWVSVEQVTLNADVGVEFLDAENLHFPLRLRPWRSGDRFVPLGMTQAVRISDFLTNLKIKGTDRQSVYVLESNGEIVAVVGHRLSERFKIKNSTKKAIKLIVKAS